MTRYFLELNQRTTSLPYTPSTAKSLNVQAEFADTAKSNAFIAALKKKEFNYNASEDGKSITVKDVNMNQLAWRLGYDQDIAVDELRKEIGAISLSRSTQQGATQSR